MHTNHKELIMSKEVDKAVASMRNRGYFPDIFSKQILTKAFKEAKKIENSSIDIADRMSYILYHHVSKY